MLVSMKIYTAVRIILRDDTLGKREGKTVALLVICLLMPVSSFFINASAEEEDGGRIHVGADRDQQCIQEAIDSASEGDVIMIDEGVYYENIVVDKELTLIGAGSQRTILNGSLSGNVITVEHRYCEIMNLSATGSGREKDEAGIWVEYNDVRIENCRCWGNQYGIILNETRGCEVLLIQAALKIRRPSQLPWLRYR